MADLEYSVDALNVKSAFYRAKTLVYVEGDDDVLFWHEVFSRVPDAHVEVEAAGGSDEIDKYIAKIAAGQLDAIAARDADLLSFVGGMISNPRVLYTPGYSIENSLYTADALVHLTRLWCKTTKITLEECEQWLSDLATAVAPLLHLDLANRMTGGGASTIGDNCTRFMTGQASATPCKTKIAAHLAVVASKVPLKAKAKAESTIGFHAQDILRHVRGHFLASAALKYILAKAKTLGRRIDISADALYAAALAHFGKVFGHKHPHQDHYLSKAAAAWDAIA